MGPASKIVYVLIFNMSLYGVRRLRRLLAGGGIEGWAAVDVAATTAAEETTEAGTTGTTAVEAAATAVMEAEAAAEAEAAEVAEAAAVGADGALILGGSRGGSANTPGQRCDDSS